MNYLIYGCLKYPINYDLNCSSFG